MPQIPSAKLLVVENAPDHQLNAVHSFVTENAGWWWHHVPHIWVIGENERQTSVWWRDQVQALVPVISRVPTVLVFQLPPPGPGNRDWAYWGPNSKNEIGWLETEYQG